MIPDAERFWGKVLVAESGPCWLWGGAKSHRGYGLFHKRGTANKNISAHKYAWEAENGPVPAGLHLMHTCDIRACVNPAHLCPGTPAQNSQDMVKKGRSTRGEKNPCARLTALQAAAIRNDGRTQATIAREYGLDPSTVSNIKSGKLWR